VKAIRRITVRTILPERLAALEDLALNLQWSWNPGTRDLFAAIDTELWEQVGHDPVRLLGEVSAERLAQLSADEGFVQWVDHASSSLNEYLASDRWYQHIDSAPCTGIAYFSPEFGITGVLPQYSGGLGILAGDHLKSASDLGVPIIGLGLFYRSGYFRQSLSRDGWQLEQYPVCDPDGSPVTLLREDDGTPAKIAVGLPGGRSLTARIWIAHVGRVPLLLLDSHVEDNAPAEREITDRLYGGGGEYRLQQEMLLGIGGIRALRTYCRITGTPSPNVYHTNEGHAGFLGIERIRELLKSDVALDFDSALEAVRAGTVFTTHTPVPAGIDRFPVELIEIFFGGENAVPEVPVDRITALGAETYPGGDPAVFNMAVMGLRLAGRANGVSLLHGEVSRGMFSGLWPGFEGADIPITSITNGVHAPTWVARPVMDLAREIMGPEFTDEAQGWERLGEISDERFWEVKRALRNALVEEARDRLRESWRSRGSTDAELGWIDNVLDPDVLTLGFARRVPSYKRLTLMLRDADRLRALLTDPQRPIQLVIAGKAHPNDEGGKKLIQQLVQFADEEGVRERIVFLPNYDMNMATVLYPGCDVWLNNPIRPLEASGTSGMKAALNGALNLSIMDGWWDEWFDGENGWAIPSADGIDDADRRDDLEAAALYDLIANSVAPAFYDRDHRGVPPRWMSMVRHTLRTLGPKVLASRMVREYVERLYLPAARSADAAQVDNFALARELAAWKSRVRNGWNSVRVEHVEADGVADAVTLGQDITVRAYVALGELGPEDVAVQVLAGRVDADDVLVDPETYVMNSVEGYESGRWKYEVQLRLDHNGPFGYTVRIVPQHRGMMSSAELGLCTQPQVLSAASEVALR
jgi:starch phosphorylase